MAILKFTRKAGLAFAAGAAVVATLSGGGLAQTVASTGDALFKQRCAACHSVVRGKAGGVGPNLAGVVGRKSGAVSGYAYSTGMKKANLSWNAASLDRFLAAPAKVVPGTKMVIAVSDAAQRKALITYLGSVK